jgi:large subunit ribosomal protein L20
VSASNKIQGSEAAFKANVELNRKMLAQLAILDPASFAKIAELANSVNG